MQVTAKEAEARRQVLDVLDKSNASDAVKRRILRNVRDRFMTTEQAAKDVLRTTQMTVAASKEALRWLEEHAPIGFVLQKNDCSRLHKLREAAASDRTGDLDGDDQGKSHKELLDHFEHTFVVKHNWASAFAGAEGISEEYRLPYEHCVFEFRVSGKTVIALTEDFGDKKEVVLFLETADCWLCFGDSTGLVPMMWDQIRSICIALDAQVATHSVVRAPHKLNEKRVRDGKYPLSDFHVVDLSRRTRISNPPPESADGSKRRLHFRRGHWRHFDSSKTWIRWCLVGDPDLGFIEKNYSL